jgi:hypothetical protein
MWIQTKYIINNEIYRIISKDFFVLHWKDTMLICYSFKLKYLNKIFFYSTLIFFFLMNIEYIYYMALNFILKK